MRTVWSGDRWLKTAGVGCRADWRRREEPPAPETHHHCRGPRGPLAQAAESRPAAM